MCVILVHHSGLHLNGFDGEVSSTDLLRDTTSFAFLHVGLTDLVIQRLSVCRVAGYDARNRPCPAAWSFRYRRVQGYSKWGCEDCRHCAQPKQLHEPWRDGLRLQPFASLLAAARRSAPRLMNPNLSPSPSPSLNRLHWSQNPTLTLTKKIPLSSAQLCLAQPLSV